MIGNWKVDSNRWAEYHWSSYDNSWKKGMVRNMQLAAAHERGLWLRLGQEDMATEQDSSSCIGQIPVKTHIDITSHLRHL